MAGQKATQVRVGLSSDELLKLWGRSAEHTISIPTVVGEDGAGLVVVWHFPDCDVILKYRGDRYRVTEVLEVH